MSHFRLSLVATLLLAATGCKSSSAKPMDAGAIIPCTSSAQCPANLPMCHAPSGLCVGCIASFQTCGDKQTCDEATHTCIPLDPNAPCKRSVDCPRLGVNPSVNVACEVDSGLCVECASNLDCVAPDTCSTTHTCLTIPDDGGAHD